MSGIVVEANSITVSDDSDHDFDVLETAVESNIYVLPDVPGYRTAFLGTAVEAHTTQINSSAKQTCGSMDLSWAFDAPLQELLKGHPNDQHRLPLRALAEGLEKLANNKGIAISDLTLFQVLQGLEDSIDSHQKFNVNGSWEFKVAKMIIGGSDVLIRVAMTRSFLTHYDIDPYDEEEHRLALRLRTKPGRESPLDRGLTYAVCSGCVHKIMDEWRKSKHSEDLDRLFDSGETAVSCIILSSQLMVSTSFSVVWHVIDDDRISLMTTPKSKRRY